MPIKDPSILQIELMFEGLNKAQALGSFPEQGALSGHLTKLVEKAKGDSFTIDTIGLNQFASAAVEMWHRSIHSFLISASLTKASPIWSSVAGYYSSHYSIRAFAHLLGCFQLFSIKKIIRLEVNGKSYTCQIIGKNGGDREHKLYWKTVKAHNLFTANPFFTNNDDAPKNSMNAKSDVSHRTKSNYLDHINGFPKFQVLDDAYLKVRVEKISNIELSDAPIPRMDFYPDLENVQVIAYQRMISFMSFLDEILGGSNKFWALHRRPNWAPKYLDYQVIKPEFTTIYKK